MAPWRLTVGLPRSTLARYFTCRNTIAQSAHRWARRSATSLPAVQEAPGPQQSLPAGPRQPGRPPENAVPVLLPKVVPALALRVHVGHVVQGGLPLDGARPRAGGGAGGAGEHHSLLRRVWGRGRVAPGRLGLLRHLCIASSALGSATNQPLPGCAAWGTQGARPPPSTPSAMQVPLLQRQREGARQGREVPALAARSPRHGRHRHCASAPCRACPPSPYLAQRPRTRPHLAPPGPAWPRPTLSSRGLLDSASSPPACEEWGLGRPNH